MDGKAKNCQPTEKKMNRQTNKQFLEKKTHSPHLNKVSSHNKAIHFDRSEDDARMRKTS